MKIGTVEETIDKSIELLGRLDHTLEQFEESLAQDLEGATDAAGQDNAYQCLQTVKGERKEIGLAMRNLEIAKGRIGSVLKLLG